jgi:predicted nucleic acid-binding protein
MAPAHMPVEVTSALRRLTLMGELEPAEGGELIAALGAMSVRYVDVRPLLPRVWELRDTVSAQDGPYVALAEREDCVLVTTDGRLSRASGLRCEVKVIVP